MISIQAQFIRRGMTMVDKTSGAHLPVLQVGTHPDGTVYIKTPCSELRLSACYPQTVVG